jgi:chemotaxis signal transduction protein
MTYLDRNVGDRYCLLRQGDFYFAVSAKQVREVLPAPQLTAVPNADSVLAGLFHHRNEFLAVLCPHILTNTREVNSQTQPTQMIVIERSEGGWGFLVDEVIGLSALEVCINADVRHADAAVDAFWGTATHQDRVVHVVDPKKLYRIAESELRRRWTESLVPSATCVLQAVTRVATANSC